MRATIPTTTVSTQRNFFLDDVREASWASILFVCAAQIVSVTAFVWKPGLLSLALTWSLCIAAGIFAMARQRPDDLGLSLRGILPGIAYAVAWYVLTQAALFGITVARGLPTQWPVLAGNMGSLVDQLLFFALGEEIVSRGFLMTQSYLKLCRMRLNGTVALTAAILLSQSFFGLAHIPHRMVEHTPLAELPMNLALTAVSGVLFCLVYLRTANLLVPLAVHAVSNVPDLFLGTLNWHSKNMILAAVALLVAEIYARLAEPRIVKLAGVG